MQNNGAFSTDLKALIFLCKSSKKTTDVMFSAKFFNKKHESPFDRPEFFPIFGKN